MNPNPWCHPMKCPGEVQGFVSRRESVFGKWEDPRAFIGTNPRRRQRWVNVRFGLKFQA
jgi:hypothetical protein